ncbi:hypothetical protein CC78DRAFT_340909 [Lojkania enalia]|uniref:Uncharacterized protein n=1 Tax=Lojkania enalia TaxID=147567 RepID=A0A9P4K2K9_9PLEO|nr:hypothetical protein CC78DRAFT_340909 [Didymosphaeria enalia]
MDLPAPTPGEKSSFGIAVQGYATFHIIFVLLGVVFVLLVSLCPITYCLIGFRTTRNGLTTLLVRLKVFSWIAKGRAILFRCTSTTLVGPGGKHRLRTHSTRKCLCRFRFQYRHGLGVVQDDHAVNIICYRIISIAGKDGGAVVEACVSLCQEDSYKVVKCRKLSITYISAV